MILPIYTFGQPVLKKKCTVIEKMDAAIQELTENMWETMYNADGVGLAAPQIGQPLRLFIIDTIQLKMEDEEGIKQAFYNAEMLEEWGEEWAYEEGCLSIPDIRADVIRPSHIRISYQDEKFNHHEATFSGINARVIQHEYDHTEGKLFTEKLRPLKKRRIKKKLEAIKTGNIESRYKMKFFRV